MIAIEPVRLYQADNGIWRGEIKRGGRLRWFSLHTRDEVKARIKWAAYCDVFNAVMAADSATPENAAAPYPKA